MNKIGIYYAYWTQDWDVDFHPFIDRVANLGFDVLEINAGTVEKMNSEERCSLKAHANDKDLALSYCIGLPYKHDISSLDASIHKDGVAYLQRLANVIGEMGGGELGGIIYGAWPATFTVGMADKFSYAERSITGMREAIKAAEDNDVFFNMEVVNRFEQFLLNTCVEAIDYVDAVGSPNVGILLDTFHMNIEEDFINEAILRAGDRLRHFHIGENNRMTPGYGHIPWTEIGATLRKINYQGYVVMEPFISPGGQVGRDIKVHRDMGTGLDRDEEARKALSFVRGFLK